MKRVLSFGLSAVLSAGSVILVLLLKEKGWVITLLMLVPAFAMPLAFKRIGSLFSILLCGGMFLILLPLNELEKITVILIFSFSLTLSLINGFAAYWKSSLKKQKEKLSNLGTIDKLTDTYTRIRIIEILKRLMKIADRYESQLCICSIGLDNLKYINNQFGSSAGDMFIKICIEAIRKIVRNTDSIGRIGGDEFLILFDRCSTDQAQIIMNRIRSSLKGQEIHNHKIDFSFGLSSYNSTKLITTDEIISIAETRMRRQKENKRVQNN